MSILLTILKVLGILLLILLGVALALILAVLFVPIRYRIEGAYEDTYHLRVRAGWLLSLLFFHYELEEEKQGGRLRLFGIPILRFGDEDYNGKEEASAEKEEEPKEEELTEETALALQEKEQDAINDTEANSSPAKTDREQKKTRQSAQTAEKPQKWRLKKRSGSKKKSKSKISWIQKAKAKLRTVLTKCNELRKLIFTEENKTSASLVLREIRYLFRHYGFRKVSGEVQFSAGDPALTGECLGFISMFPFFYRDKRTLIPDFLSEEFYIKGHGKATGKVRMIHLIRSILHIWQDKNIRGLIHQIRK